MKIKIKGTKNQTAKLPAGSCVKDLLSLIKVSEHDVLIVRNGNLIVSTAKLRDGETLELIEVVSGG